MSTRKFNPEVDREKNRGLWEIPLDAPVAGIVARMQPHRGHLEMIQTFADISKKIPKAHYIIAGRGEMKKPIRAIVAAHPSREQLHEVGYRKKDLPETYAAMDVSLILAAGSDGSCRAMLEAMACGRPVIGVRTGAIAETIEHGKTGWLIDPRNLKSELTGAIIDALADRARAAEMGRAARQDIEKNFTNRLRTEKTLEAYGAALMRRSR